MVHCLFGDARFKVTSHYNFKLQLKCNEDNIFFKKKKKGKHSRKRNKKKSLPLRCNCITFTLSFMFGNSMSMCHADIFFLKAVNKLLFSTWWVFFHAGAVQIRWNKRCCLYLLFFSMFFFFLLFLKFVCAVWGKMVRIKLSWSVRAQWRRVFTFFFFCFFLTCSKSAIIFCCDCVQLILTLDR